MLEIKNYCSILRRLNNFFLYILLSVQKKKTAASFLRGKKRGRFIPCIRMIIEAIGEQEENSPVLYPGALFIVTKDGGQILSFVDFHNKPETKSFPLLFTLPPWASKSAVVSLAFCVFFTMSLLFLIVVLD